MDELPRHLVMDPVSYILEGVLKNLNATRFANREELGAI